jgi:hypothetical protein
LNVFPFSDRNKNEISVKINSGDFKNLYGLSSGKFTKTISLKMNVESGILNFLGSKNNVTIADRSKTENNDQIIVKSSITIQSYLLGVKFKTIKYRITEYLNEKGLLQKQTFNDSEGNYFIGIYV